MHSYAFDWIYVKLTYSSELKPEVAVHSGLISYDKPTISSMNTRCMRRNKDETAAPAQKYHGHGKEEQKRKSQKKGKIKRP